MDFARFKPRTAAMLAVGGLIVAALIGGCAAPKHSDRARFGTIVGVVQTPTGAAIAGAEVFIESAPGSEFFGDRGPYITDSAGRFVIGGIQQYAGQPIVVRVFAEAPGFPRTFAVVAGSRDIAFGPGVDLVTVVITLSPTSSTTTSITGGAVRLPSGTVVTFPTFPTLTPVSVADLSGANLGAPVPSGDIFLTGVTVGPATLVLPAPASVSLVNPLSCLAGTTLPVYKLVDGVFVDTGHTATVTATTIDFTVTTPGTYALFVPGSVTVSTITPTSAAAIPFPPAETVNGVSGFPGYTRILDASLQFGGSLSGNQAAFAAAGVTGITGQAFTTSTTPTTFHGPVAVVVPGGTDFGVTAQPATATVTVNIPACGVTNATGTLSTFILSLNPTLSPVPNPEHLQGHAQGEGSGS